MLDRFTEVSNQSWGNRIGGSIAGVLFGILLFIAAFPVLWWNEGRAVDRYLAISEGTASAISIDPAAVDPAHDGRIVHFSGEARSDEAVTDPEFEISKDALSLNRIVEMYQWVEDKDTKTRDKIGGGKETTTTYDYSKQWRQGRVNSSRFKHEAGHENPSMPMGSSRHSADNIHVGAFSLGDLSSEIEGGDPLTLDSLPEALRAKGWELRDGGAYLSVGSGLTIGDTRVRFEMIPYSQVSVIAQQRGDQLVPFVASNGEEFAELRMGVLNIDQMREAAESDNALKTWIIRGVGFAMMVIGMSLIMGPLTALAHVIPMLGSLVGGVTFVISLVVSVVGTSMTIAVAWLAYWPLISVPLLVIAVVAVVYLVMRSRSRKAAQAVAA